MAVGLALYYSDSGSPETWTLENYKISCHLKDTISGRMKVATMLLSNPSNTLETIYTPYKRIKLVDSISNQTLFIGRVEIITPKYDSTYGQCLEIVAKDYLQELFERYLTTYTTSNGSVINPSWTSYAVSDIIGGILNNYITTTPINPFATRYISTSQLLTTINYNSSNRFCSDVMEELASIDPWNTETWSVVCDDSSDYTTAYNSGSNIGLTGNLVYFKQTKPFFGVKYTVSSPALVNYYNQNWYYWGSSGWTPLTVISSMDFSKKGVTVVEWELPTDWVIQGSYYVAKFTTATPTYIAMGTATCNQGFGYDYMDDNNAFRYFRRASIPSGGALANGLTIEFNPTSDSNKIRAMFHDYIFSDQPKELITRVTVKGTDNAGTHVSITKVNNALETKYGIQKEKIDYISGSSMSNSDLTTYCTNRANSLLNYQGGIVNRGEFNIALYPYYGDSNTIIRAGHLVRIKCSPKNINKDYIVSEINYDDTTGIANMKVLSINFGRNYSPLEPASMIASINASETDPVSTSQINDYSAISGGSHTINSSIWHTTTYTDRNSGSNYTNSSSGVMVVCVYVAKTGSAGMITAYAGGVEVTTAMVNYDAGNLTFTVGPGLSYYVTYPNPPTDFYWSETTYTLS
jgi:hypothetical protein